MFLAKSLIGGLIKVVRNVCEGDRSFFFCVQPPPRRPLNFAQANESEEEKRFRNVFQQLAGDDMEVSPNELMNILNKVVCKRESENKLSQFSVSSCDSTGKLGFDEFKYLWNNIKRWQGVYIKHDADRSGAISSNELPNAFKDAGFPLNDELFKLIIRRYSDENGDMDFDNFIGCLVRLDCMCRAFKTLDKDNSGTIDLDIKEVKHRSVHFSMFSNSHFPC
uniref:Calpain small subunit 1 n=1 Tax=Amphilophus citrinellus TaxID=61819 RepID=A0A3Q0R8E9_AMPCI